MKKKYPLVEAIFELRWGEVAPNQFSYKNHGASGDVFLQKFSIQASKHGYEFVEKVDNSDAPPLPHHAHYRFRKEENSWPCLQIGLGVFTVNQTADGYDKQEFHRSIEDGINAWRSTLGDDIKDVLDTLTIILRFQDFFPDDNETTELQKLEDSFGIKLTFPEKFADSASRINNVEMNFSLKCESPDASMASISLKKALSKGNIKGILADTVVFTRYNAIVKNETDIKKDIAQWIEEAHEFQSQTFKQLMHDNC
ncbi:TIGR04255 family protein [Vibrio gigantis]|uniref:TIGR04255 family protein n=1 Tax=Vibrio gigantis TaxID=296199 RepID=UPI001BFDA0DF|nr:TIGR04255 family protein [Vibrio gigantis]